MVLCEEIRSELVSSETPDAIVFWRALLDEFFLIVFLFLRLLAFETSAFNEFSSPDERSSPNLILGKDMLSAVRLPTTVYSEVPLSKKSSFSEISLVNFSICSLSSISK